MPNNQPKFSVAIKSDGYQKLINDTLGDKEIARQFVADITTVVANNPTLAQCEAGTILAAGLTAQSLKLPLSQTLGQAYIIPYGNKAQFQIGAKGLTQLAMRSGQFSRIGVKPVHKGEAQGYDEFGDEIIKFDHKYDDEEVVGYLAYFELVNGFKKTLYWTKEQCERHGHKYSKSYNKLWGDESMFDAMASKTVLKQLISRYAPMSVDMQTAIKSDQAVINENGEYAYVDNPNNDKPKDRVGVQAPQIAISSVETEEVGKDTQPSEEIAPNSPLNEFGDENDPF